MEPLTIGLLGGGLFAGMTAASVAAPGFNIMPVIIPSTPRKYPHP